jgi:RNA polymerase sigma-70 factor (ECF subfamily)
MTAPHRRSQATGAGLAGRQERVRNGRRAMDEFLKSVERRAFRMAQIATGSREEALDIVQDAMLRMVSRYGKRPAEEWKPLFYRILHNRIRDWHRRNRVRTRWRVWLGRRHDETVAGDPLANIADEKAGTPADHLLGGETRRALDKAIGALPLRQQQAFLLRAWEGLSVAETARAMGCSQGSVKSHYSRSITNLRRVLEEYRR